MPPTPDLFL